MQTNEQREAFLAERMKGVGGSDVAAILGLSKWSTPYDVWQSKLGLADPTPDNDAMMWGRLLEPVIRQAYAERTGLAVAVPSDPLVMPGYSFARANLDGIRSDGRIVEIKTARYGDEWGEEGSDEVPIAYALQVQHYMMVAGADVADVAVLIGGSDFRVYTVEADQSVHDMILDAEAGFWELVQTKTPPPVMSFSDAVAAYGKASKSGEVLASAELADDVENLKRIKTEAKALEDLEKELKGRVMAALGELDTLVYGGRTLATWKMSADSQKLDAKALAAAHPDLYARFCNTVPGSRRFLFK